MAHRITYKPSGILLSSAIGNVGIQVDGTFVDVTLTATAGRVILSERYYAYGGYVTLYDLASLIEAEMRSSAYTYADFTLRVFTDTTANKADSHTFHILYCDRFTVCNAVPFFLKENFLTTLSNRRVADGSTLSLFFYAEKGESIAYTIAYRAYRPDTHGIFNSQYTLDTGKIASSSGVLQINISTAEILQRIYTTFAPATKDTTILQSFTVSCGQRAVTCFVDRLLSEKEAFFFKNCFNVYDVAYLPLQTTAKIDVDRSTAVINGSSSFYNQSATKKYEVVAGPLTSDEAEWIDQLFTSYDVFRIEPNDCDDSDPLILTPVMITDITCEVSDSDEKPNTVKFTWRFCDNRPIVRFSATRGIFTAQYDLRYS